MGLITYGVNDNERAFPKSSYTPPQMDYITALKMQREKALKQIDEHQKAVDRWKDELKRIETDLFIYSNQEFKNIYAEQGLELSKKNLIIEYYKRNIPQEKIAEAVGVKSNYVSKVLCEYRKEMGIDAGTKGQRTKQRIIQCLSSGMSINQTANTVEVTPQYVNAVRREFNIHKNGQ